MRKTMTLGEFRKYTEHLDDSIELSYHYAGENVPIKTMIPIGDSKIEFAGRVFEQNDTIGCLQVAALLKKNNDNYEKD